MGLVYSLEILRVINRIAEVYGHRGDQGKKAVIQHAVGVSRRNSAVALGSAEGSRAARVRGVSKQDLQWMLVQWQHDQHARRELVEQGGHAWVSWQQEMEALRVLDARQQQIVGMAELAASVEREHDVLSNEEQWWSGEQIEGQEAEQRAQAQQEQKLTAWRIQAEGVDDSALEGERCGEHRRKMQGRGNETLRL